MATFEDKVLEVQKLFGERWVSEAVRCLRGDPNLTASQEEQLARIANLCRLEECEDNVLFEQKQYLMGEHIDAVRQFCDRFGYWTNDPVLMPDLDLEYEMLIEHDEVFVV